MSLAGILILLGFFVFAGLMVARWLPAILALPLMAGWVCLVAGMPFTSYLDNVLLAGSMKLSSAMAVVIFGAMFARVIMKTGISNAIIKQAAELAGDRPLAIAFIMTAATAFVFLGMSGLGAVIMVGSITLPIMMSAGISPVVSCVMLLFGIQTGLLANMANYGTYIGIFGGTVMADFYLPAVVVSAIGTLAFILLNVPRQEEAGGQGSDLLVRCGRLLRAVALLPWRLLQFLAVKLQKLFAAREEKSLRLDRRRAVPAPALLAPVLPLVTVYFCKGYIGFGKASEGLIDPVAASILGFFLASFYAVGLTRPSQAVNVLAGAIVEGLKDIAGVLFLFMGIGMLVAAVMDQGVSQVLNPLLASLLPTGRWELCVFFAILAPTALYRGPLNMFGMGAGIAVLLVSLDMVPLAALAGIFLAVQYIQASCDPTNSHNTWIGGYANVDTADILKKVLPYSWGMCILMLLYTTLTKW